MDLSLWMTNPGQVGRLRGVEGQIESGAGFPQSAAARRPRVAAAVVGALIGASLALGGSDPTVRFLEPRNLATVLGPTSIRLLLDVPDPATVDRVELHIDGKRFGLLEQPPWTIPWHAGDGWKGHSLEAVMVLSDGRQVRATIRTSPLRIQQVENVDLVNLYLVVRAGDRYVTDLTAGDFRIYEDGVEQRVARFTTTHKPLRVAVVVDSSRSMSKEDRLEKSKSAALQFLEILTDDDEGTVISFSDTVDVLQSLSSDKTLLANAIRKISLAHGTALYDSIWRTSDLLADFDGRRVMVLLSDGQDQAYNGMEQGSLHTLDEALERALRAEVMIFPIGLGQRLERTYLLEWDYPGAKSRTNKSKSLADLLRDLATSTGGRAVMSKSSGQLRKAFSEIAADLRHQYSIAYQSTNGTRKGKWRTIRVETPRGFEIVTRRGYYGPKPAKMTRR